MLVEGTDRLLGDFPARLGEYACRTLTRRRVDVRLSTLVESTGEDFARLSTGEVIPCRTVVWSPASARPTRQHRPRCRVRRAGATGVTGEGEKAVVAVDAGGKYRAKTWPLHPGPIIKGLTPHGKRHGLKVWMDEDQIPDALKSERLGHDEPGMRGVYGHVSPAMREELKAALQARWEESLRQRATLSPVSAVPLLARAGHRVPHHTGRPARAGGKPADRRGGMHALPDQQRGIPALRRGTRVRLADRHRRGRRRVPAPDR